MTTPKYHRDRRIAVAIFTSDGASVIPRLHIQFDGTCLTVEPLWDEIEEFRWVEPDASR
jgi:hypothetical protein